MTVKKELTVTGKHRTDDNKERCLRGKFNYTRLKAILSQRFPTEVSSNIAGWRNL